MKINYNTFYKLVDKTPIPCPFNEWKDWYMKADHRIKETYIKDVVIITCFNGIGVIFKSEQPLLFETYVSGGIYDRYIIRSLSYDDALEVHEKIVYKVMHPTILDRIKFCWKKLFNKFKKQEN